MAGIAAYACRICEDYNGAINPCILVVSAEAVHPSECPFLGGSNVTPQWEEVDLSALLYQIVVSGCRR